MTTIFTITRRELMAYFFSPIAYVVLTLFLLIQGYSFWMFTSFLSQPNAPHGAVLQFFFGGTFLYWMFLVFVVAALTMRLVAEERRVGTLEMLMTAPVTEAQIIGGKFVAAWLFYGVLWAPTLVYVWVLRVYSPSGAGPEMGPVAAAYLGTMLIGAAFVAVGLLASTLTRNQIIAAVLAFVFLSLLLLLGILEFLMQAEPAWQAVIKYLNLFTHMETFARGIVDTRVVTFYVSLTALALFASVRALEAAKARP